MKDKSVLHYRRFRCQIITKPAMVGNCSPNKTIGHLEQAMPKVVAPAG